MMNDEMEAFHAMPMLMMMKNCSEKFNGNFKHLIVLITL